MRIRAILAALPLLLFAGDVSAHPPVRTRTTLATDTPMTAGGIVSASTTAAVATVTLPLSSAVA